LEKQYGSLEARSSRNAIPLALKQRNDSSGVELLIKPNLAVD
jgi:hypothetical protein